ncbi:helix-turn-helix domain-containing protein [Arthrobacter sp. efr-133-TYG-118]|uniref:helix-turn-helix domain-containing protein n=1 Tax=Arthrobacter sp. efr-133-TYG-118 TaxID=3040279 RepID=UPI00254AC078|nr:helix-turn-helix domain-containing protein [Arthrobacter sp. efr-133-TYG-118]
MTEPRFLTIAEVAGILVVNESTVRGLIKRGDLRAFQIGGRGIWRIGRDDLEAYITDAYRRTAERIAAGEFPD